MKQEIGKLLHLYLEEIEIDQPVSVPEFLIRGAAQAIQSAGDRNWVPLIVKQTGAERYQVIANGFVLAAAEQAGLHKVWCIIADDSAETQQAARILAQEEAPKINLAQASRDDIKAGLEYLIHRSVNPLTGVTLATATERIASAPRHTWKVSLGEVTSLKCGITKGKKLDIFKEIFCTIPEPILGVKISTSNATIGDRLDLKKLSVKDLKTMAKERGIAGYSKLKKDELLAILSVD